MLFSGNCNIAPTFGVSPDRRELPFCALAVLFWPFVSERTACEIFHQCAQLVKVICYIQDNERSAGASISPSSSSNTPHNAPFQLWLSDYTKGKVQVVCDVLYTDYLSLAESSYLKDSFPKALYVALLPLALTTEILDY